MKEGTTMTLNKYTGKLVTPQAAAEQAVRSGDWVEYGFGGGFPELMDKALAARKGELKDIRIRGGLVIRPRIEAVECDPEQTTFHYYSWHIGDYERKLQSRGLVQFMPVMLRALPYLYRDRHIRTDVAFVPVSQPDENGYCGLGISNFAWRTMFESARTVVFEINERLPKLQGVDGSHRVHLSEADFIVEGEHEPLPVRSYRDPSPEDIRIAQYVVNEIPDGAVLSLGVGGVPYTVARMLAESDRKDLGCHTGTISDAFLELYRAGKLTNSRKEIDNGYSAWNLAMGSQALYDWLDEEPDLFHPADLDYIHSPERIGRMKNVISINGGVELDLMGQENAESAGTRQLSGIGGQMDFLEGAFRSRGGKGFICLNSVHRKKDGTLKSNIVPCISGGSTVSAPRTMIQYVVTEYGVACLPGLSLRERAEAMAAIAHPDFREELLRYARENFPA
ncbi:acetyl-CoA hydrolase/transferase family protein [Dysosmobacter sp. HCP28S3_G4]|uniref:acetyl-CoA hydrolase/transferase family protein n=1 Tax=Dysosmobacter sp. HCP28S3_G4 TaxID=3438938 RepID=UPI003F893825